MSERKERRGCLKGCALGCLLFVVLGLGIAGIVGVLQLRASGVAVDSTSEHKQQRLPQAPATEGQLADARTGRELTLTGSQAAEQFAQPDLGSGTLVVEFQQGTLTLLPSDSDSIEVDADFDQARFELVEEYAEGADGEWTYTVRLETKRRFLGFTTAKNRVEIRVPRNRPFRLEGDIKMGESDLELGGLWLRSVDLQLGMGQHNVRFSEPTLFPLESFEMEGRMGQISVLDLGNASPAEVDTSHRMGQFDLDLGGAWRTDATVRARCRMGECSIRAARGVHYESDGTTVLMGGKVGSLPDDSDVEPDAPTIRLDLGASMGSVRIH